MEQQRSEMNIKDKLSKKCQFFNLNETKPEFQINDILTEYWFSLVWFVGFYGISTFVGYLTPNPFYVNYLFYLKQFSLA